MSDLSRMYDEKVLCEKALTRLRAREAVLVEALTGLTNDCPDCGGTGTVYMLMDETEVGMTPGSSGRDCSRCSQARKALANLAKPSGE